MQRYIAILSALAWLLLLSASVGDAWWSQEFWRGPAAGELDGERVVEIAPDQAAGPAPLVFLQAALLQLAEQDLDETILAAGEVALVAAEPTRIDLGWFGPEQSAVFDVLAERRQELLAGRGRRALSVVSLRYLGPAFRQFAASASFTVVVQAVADGLVTLQLREFAGRRQTDQRLGEQWKLDAEPSVTLADGEPWLVLQAEHGQMLLLRTSSVRCGDRRIEQRQFWRQAWRDVQSPRTSDGTAALAAMVWRDPDLLAKARSVPRWPDLPANATEWLREQHHYAALACGDVPPDAAGSYADPFTFARVLAWRALWLQTDAGAARRVATWLRPEIDLNGFASAMLAARHVPPAPIAREWESLRQEAALRSTPSWLQGSPWLLQVLCGLALLTLAVAIAGPRRVQLELPLTQRAAWLLAVVSFVSFGPFDGLEALLFAAMLVRRWPSLSRFWRLVGGLVLLGWTTWLLLWLGALPYWPAIVAMVTGGTSGVWIVVAAWVVTDGRWRAPLLLQAAVLLLLAGLWASSPLAALWLVSLVKQQVYAYAGAVLLFMLGFLLLGCHRCRSAADQVRPTSTDVMPQPA